MFFVLLQALKGSHLSYLLQILALILPSPKKLATLMTLASPLLIANAEMQTSVSTFSYVQRFSLKKYGTSPTQARRHHDQKCALKG
jgi:hypothetical protein